MGEGHGVRLKGVKLMEANRFAANPKRGSTIIPSDEYLTQ